jgi:hypothetical protein
MATEDQIPPPSPPPQMVLYQMAVGHYLSRAVCLAAKLRIADLLKDGPRRFDYVARATGTDPAALNRVMRLLASAGVFDEKENGNFALTALGQPLREDVPGSTRALVMMFAGDWQHDAWKDLEYSVRTGEPTFRKRGFDDLFAEMAGIPEEAANFDAAMADFTRLIAIAVATAYDFGSLQTLVDVGGGNGALLIGLLNANPRLHGIVFDQPAVAERARKQVAESGLAERCEAIGGDFFKEVPGGADAYILKHIIHDWSDDLALMILRNCRGAMAANGKLLLVEGIFPSRFDQSAGCRIAAANDVNMLVNTGGRQRTESEFHSLFARAGFELTRIVPTKSEASSFPVNVIEGVPRHV